MNNRYVDIIDQTFYFPQEGFDIDINGYLEFNFVPLKYLIEKYGTPYFGWLILAANPMYGGLEQNIPDGTILIIPYPLTAALQDYKSSLDTHIFYYGR